jgi:hypothetical protein
MWFPETNDDQFTHLSDFPTNRWCEIRRVLLDLESSRFGILEKKISGNWMSGASIPVVDSW